MVRPPTLLCGCLLPPTSYVGRVDLIGTSFTPYGPSTWLMWIVSAIGAVGAIIAGRRLRGTVAATRLCRALAVVLFTLTLSHLLVELWPANFAVGRSLPLQFSDALRFIAAYALWSRRRWAFAITYYWGLTLNSQSLLTPNLDYVLAPWYDFSAYWSLHILVLWATVLLTWGVGERPTWRSYRLAIIGTVGWAALAFAVNLIAGTNYGFLNAKPASPSALNFLGGWPFYLLVEFVAMIVIWALITWPWVRRVERPPRPRRLIGTRS